MLDLNNKWTNQKNIHNKEKKTYINYKLLSRYIEKILQG
jgi:hypothetical protein